MESEDGDGLRLLALDGGGIRGLSELLILGEIMNRIKSEKGLKDAPRPCEYFDVIGGTSTGGLIAILLGRLCMSVEDAIKAYNEFAGRVFSDTKCLWQDGTFKASTFEAVVKDIVARYDNSGDENALMMSDVSKKRKCKMFVCAMASNNISHPRLFRSYEVRSNQGHNSTIWEAARATSAAPTFFKPIEIGTDPKEEFIDGGLRCNNPTAEVYNEARNIHGIDHPISCIVSIGAGHPNAISLRKPSMWKNLFSRSNYLMEALEAIAADCEKVSEEFGRTYVRGGRNGSGGGGGAGMIYFRFNVQQGLQGVSLAEWTKMGEVKTHTLQYLRGATVDAEIDRVTELLKMRTVDEHGGQGQRISVSSAGPAQVPQETFLKEKVTTSLIVIFDTVTHYKRLLSCDEADAQKILDAFQTLLDTESFRDRGQLIAAMRRLSERTNLYPTRFFLKGSSPPSLPDAVAAGHFGDVYRISFQGEDTCFKVIRLYQRSEVEHVAKVFAKEAVVWAQLSHPNILPFYGLTQVGARLAFVSPWATNGNLEGYLTNNPGANRLLLCSDTAAGVEYLHKNDIVHGDLKGVNVLVDCSGRAALGDLGLASVTDPRILKWTTQSSMASKGGTERWQAPELLEPEDTSEKTIKNTKASDVFAWAHVCYEIFTGNVPYHQHRIATLSIQKGETPKRPEDTDPAWLEHGLTNCVWELMKDCWTFNPSGRPDMTSVVSRLDVEKPLDSRPRGEWGGKVAMHFRNAQVSRKNMLPFWKELDSVLSRVLCA